MRKIKSITAFVLAAALALTLGGCNRGKEVDLEALGWQESWTVLGGLLAVEEPVEGFALEQNNDALSPSGIWVAAWSAGEGEPYENADGNEATLYDAEIYLLVMECKSASAASAQIESLENQERENYTCGEKSTGAYAGQEFGVFSMTNNDAENPYARGAAALTVWGKYVVTVEMLCQADFDGEPLEIVENFLNLIHYNGEAA